MYSLSEASKHRFRDYINQNRDRSVTNLLLGKMFDKRTLSIETVAKRVRVALVNLI